MRGAWAGVVVAISLVSATANAQVSEPRSFSAQRFRLSLDRQGMLNVEWAGVPGHLSFDVSLWMGIVDDPLTVYRTSESGGGTTRVGSLVATQVGGGLSFALAFYDWVQFGVDVPFALYQTRDSTIPGIAGQLEALKGGGLGSPRLSPKIRILSQEDVGIHLAFVPAFTIPTGQTDAYLGQTSFVFEPTLLAARTIGALRVGGNLGVRVRQEERFADLEVDDEFFASIGAGLRLSKLGGPPMEVDLAAAIALAAEDPFGASNQNYVEALAGASIDVAGPLVAFAGGGIGLNQGFGSPDWRALLGIRISDHQRDSDGDGIIDDDDSCPDLREDFDDYLDEDGCPDPDNDGDGVLDAADGAPFDPEDIDGFEDADGVPDYDDDKDGILDWDDKCPRVAGAFENSGCPDADADADGIIDRLDTCPNDAEDRDDFEDDDGCPDPDDDGDGVLDASDRCRMIPGRADNHGCPDADTDKDGIVDRLDNCPDQPGVPEQQGCARRQLVVIGETKLEILERVYFDSGRDTIQARSNGLLDNVAAVLNAHPEIAGIIVEGHTDDRGRDDTNLKLSDRRAQAVMRYLVGKNVEASRLEAIGFGEEKPVSTNRTAEGRANNRRVEFVIKRAE